MPEDLKLTLSDSLRELGNIGCNRALTALSQMTATDFAVKVPDIEFIEYSVMPQRLGSVEEETVSLLLEVSGDLDGTFLLLLRPETAAQLLTALGLPAPQSFHALDPRQHSALLELGNIMCSSYMTAVSELTGLESGLTIPAYAVDMLGALLSLPIIRFAEAESKMLYIQNVFTIAGRDWSGCTLLLPTLDSAQKLGERLGARR